MIAGALILAAGVVCWILAGVVSRRSAAAVLAATVAAAVIAAGGPSAGAVPDGPRAVSAVAVATRPACRWDDGSGTGHAPCVWDGRHLGNGVGRSFLAIPVYPFRGHDPIIRYVSHRAAHRMLFGGVR